MSNSIDKKGKAYKQLKNARARQKYIQTIECLKQEPVKGWRSLNAKQCKQLCEQAYNGSPRRKKKKLLRIVGANKRQIKMLLGKERSKSKK